MSSESISFSQTPPSQRYRKRKRPASMEIIEDNKPSQTIRTITRIPSSRKRRGPIIHKFKRTFNRGVIGPTDGINPLLDAFNFSFNDMPNYAEFTALYDFYKITGVVVRLIPYTQTESNSTGAVNNSRNPPIFYVIDRSDSTAPATVDELLEYKDHKITTVYEGFKIWIPNPKFADATSASRGGWVATSNPSLNWYGLKIAIPLTVNATSFYMTQTFYVSCKDPK